MKANPKSATLLFIRKFCVPFALRSATTAAAFARAGGQGPLLAVANGEELLDHGCRARNPRM